MGPGAERLRTSAERLRMRAELQHLAFKLLVSGIEAILLGAP